jgi:pyrroloquinoline quinone biosynthesis protein B
VHVALLGTAAGGGVPQWNCWCPVCEAARHEPELVRPRTQSSIAVSADGEHWFLCNASPDVHEQVRRLGEPPGDAVRRTPIEGIVLTDAELDHSLGLVLLREGRALDLYATPAVAAILERDSRLLPVARAFACVRVHELPLDAPLPLRLRGGEPAGLVVEAFAVPGDPPRFASGAGTDAGHTVGLLIRDTGSGTACAFVPACGALDAAVLSRLAAADLVLFDGTFWAEDELITLGISDLTATAMGHIPISGPHGSLRELAGLTGRRVVYTHLNNTNRVLLEQSAERGMVDAAGVLVGVDGMRFHLSRRCE